MQRSDTSANKKMEIRQEERRGYQRRIEKRRHNEQRAERSTYKIPYEKSRAEQTRQAQRSH